MRLFGASNVLALDWGGAQTRVWSNAMRGSQAKAGEIVRLDQLFPQWNEASILAVETATRKVVAIGKEAAAMEGRVTSGVEVIRPLQRGRIFDQDFAQLFLQLVWQQAYTSRIWWQPVVAVSVPAAATSLDRQVMSEVIERAGAQEIVTVTQPLAAAIGAGIPVADASGSFIVQLGYEVMEAGIISLGTLVNYQSSWHAGKWLIDRIVEALREQRELLISKQTAAQLLEQVVSLDDSHDRQMLTAGQDVVTHSPREIMITARELDQVVQPWAFQVVELVQELLAAVPPELTTDVIDKGILLSGGVAQIDGLEQFLMSRLGTPVSVVEEPTLTVLRGLATVIQHISEYQRSLAYVTTQTY